MRDTAKLNQLAKNEIDRLEAAGVDLTPAEIVHLNALGWEVQTPETRLHLSRGVPVAVADIFLWPMSLYAQDWFSRVGSEFKGAKTPSFALAYAMAKGREPGEPLAMSGKPARKKVLAWAKKLRCNEGELMVAVSQVLAQEESFEQPPSETGGMGVGEFSASLVAACGGDPDFWERRCSAGYTHAVLDALARQKDTSDHPADYDARIRAERALGWAAEKIAVLRGVQDPPDGWKIDGGELVRIKHG